MQGNQTEFGHACIAQHRYVSHAAGVWHVLCMRTDGGCRVAKGVAQRDGHGELLARLQAPLAAAGSIHRGSGFGGVGHAGRDADGERAALQHLRDRIE